MLVNKLEIDKSKPTIVISVLKVDKAIVRLLLLISNFFSNTVAQANNSVHGKKILKIEII